MLKVQDFKTRARRSTETAVEKAWAATWKEMGIYSRHMSDAIPGLPDRYVASGVWVEFKSLYRVRGEFTYGEGLSPEQWTVGRELLQAGDHVYYCAQLDGWDRGKCYTIMSLQLVIEKRGEPLKDSHIFVAASGCRKMLTQDIMKVGR